MNAKEAKKKPPVTTEKFVIEIMNGPEDGRQIICKASPITIGRVNENAVSLRCDQLVSRHHARITRSEEGFTLSDLGSTNGTFVGKSRVRKTVKIAPDELFRIGGTLLRIQPS